MSRVQENSGTHTDSLARKLDRNERACARALAVLASMSALVAYLVALTGVDVHASAVLIGALFAFVTLELYAVVARVVMLGEKPLGKLAVFVTAKVALIGAILFSRHILNSALVFSGLAGFLLIIPAVVVVMLLEPQSVD